MRTDFRKEAGGTVLVHTCTWRNFREWVDNKAPEGLWRRERDYEML